jgi:hypothetical protein
MITLTVLILKLIVKLKMNHKFRNFFRAPIANADTLPKTLT